MSDEFDIPDLDDLFSGEDEFSNEIDDQEQFNYLFIGRKSLFDKLVPIVQKFTDANFVCKNTIDEAIDLLLVDIYAIVMIDAEDPKVDLITLSRIVRVNHPLARIIGLSNSKRSLYITDIINHGSLDAYLPLPVNEHLLINILADQQAKHDIYRMLTKFVSQPPELSAASYLLLDPSLSSGEDQPEKFVGLMIAYQSIPRYSRYFEDLLAKDEILFAGYLSGITMLGQELLNSKDPLKEINFGGISVIFRFHEDLQFSIFVRNLSKHNVVHAEEMITKVLDELLEYAEEEIASTHRPKDSTLDQIDLIVDNFQVFNALASDKQELGERILDFSGQTVLFYGTDLEELEKMEKYLKNKVDYSTISFTEEDKAKTYLKQHDPAVLVIDSDLENLDVQHPLAFADFVKDDYPFIQVIYLIRDRRASGPIITSLNSGAINYLLSYRTPRKELAEWIDRGIGKAIEIRRESEVAIDGGLNSALAAKTKIRKSEESYLPENQPVLEGIFVAKEENPIFKIFWNEGVDYDDHMLAGLLASLDSVSGEMFYDENDVGGIELADTNVIVKHRSDFNIVFFVKNLLSHNINIVNKYLNKYGDQLYEVIDTAESPDDDRTHAVLDTKSNNILSDFSEVFAAINFDRHN